MPWIKRNLGLVIGGVVALALMALAGWFLWSKIQQEKEITLQLEDATARFNELLNRPVHPGNERVNNVQRAKEEHARLQKFLERLRSQIVTPDVPPDLSNRDFRALLDNTINELQREAEKMGVTLPASMTGSSKDYWFTFASQKTAVEFKNLQNLANALMDVKAICEILYEAKVHDIVSLKRVPASTDETGADFFTDKKASTNNYSIVTPYEVSFQGFSSELAKVLEGFIESKRCFVVKNMTVEKAPATSATPQMPMYNNPYTQRYNTYRMPAPAPVQPALPRRGVALDEEKLRFTLQIDSVRLKPAPQQPGARRPAVASTEPINQ